MQMVGNQQAVKNKVELRMIQLIQLNGTFKKYLPWKNTNQVITRLNIGLCKSGTHENATIHFSNLCIRA